MKTRRLNSLKLQHGVISLLTAIVLLISITLVVLFTAKTVLMETKITADDYRTSQATAAAQAAMEQGMAYFTSGGMDQFKNASTTPFAFTTTPPTLGADGAVSYNVDYSVTSPMSIILTSGTQQTTRAQFYFDNTTGCGVSAAAGNQFMDKGLIVATGWSDDDSAVRTISQCVTIADLPPPGKGGDAAPLIARSSAGISGNVTFINRYSQTTMWTGGSVDNTNAAFGTWVAPDPDSTAPYKGVTVDSDATMPGMMNDSCPSNGCPAGSAILDSNKNGNVNSSITQNDKTLANQTADEMFTDFFWGKTRAEVRAMIVDKHEKYPNDYNVYASASAVPANAKGLIWCDSGGQLPIVGTPTSPAIVIANGAVSTSSKFYGYLYATGQISMGSGDIVYGSAINEAGGFAGAGNPQVVYVPFKNANPNDPNNATAFSLPPTARTSVIGSWRDWW